MMKILNSVLYRRKYNGCVIVLLLKKSDKSSNDVFLLWPWENNFGLSLVASLDPLIFRIMSESCQIAFCKNATIILVNPNKFQYDNR